jgi:hypothetical protein
MFLLTSQMEQQELAAKQIHTAALERDRKV